MAEFICHGDFAELVPVDVYGKEMAERELPEHPESLKNRHILYRRRFTLGAFDRAVLKISADDYYKLYVNGRFVAMGPAASYPHCYNYNEIDVSDYLIEGENVIAVHTYYQGLINRVWVSGDQRQMLWCELYVDGALALESDSSWLCHDHTGYSDVCIVGYDTAYMERYDSGAVEVGFVAPDFDDSAWENAAVRKHIDYTFAGESVPLIDMYDVIPEKIESTDYGYFVDLGYEAVGYLTVSAHSARGDLVKLYYGAKLLRLVASVNRNVTATRYNRNLILKRIPTHTHCLCRDVYQAVARRLFSNQRAAVGKPTPRQYAYVLVADSLILSKQISDLSRAYADIPCRNVRIRADMTEQFRHKALAKRHNFTVGPAFGVEIRAALTAANGQARKAVFQNLFKP